MTFNPISYAKVVNVCALHKVFDLMPNGDQTLVGENGLSLSVGQIAQVSLARAIYRNAAIYLLDDPLSTVDVSVAKHIFESCILKHLNDRIRILTTHQLQFVEKATKILIVNNGECVAYGTYDEIENEGIDLLSMIEIGNEDYNYLDRKMSECSIFQSFDTIRSRGRSGSTLSFKHSVVESFKQSELRNEIIKDDTELITNEEKKNGKENINGKVYFAYLKFGTGIFKALIIIFFSLVSQAFLNGSDYFLVMWTKKNESNDVIISKQDLIYNIYIYTGIIVVLIVSTIIRGFTFFNVCTRASNRLHNIILVRLMRAQMSFFDCNLAGQILNRLAKDLGIIDENVAYITYDVQLSMLQIVGIIGACCFVSWYMIFPTIFCLAVNVFIRQYYTKTALDLKRFDGFARSKIFSHVSTTLNNLVSIRAYSVQDKFEEQFKIYLNDHSSVWFQLLSTSRLLGLITDWVSSLYLLAISFVVIFSQGDSLACFILSTSVMLSGLSPWFTLQTTEMQGYMNSIQRVLDYCNLPQEPKINVEKDNLKTWPNKGKIKFQKMGLQYQNTQKPALCNIECIIKGGEKIGIVGQSGSGKSSIISAILRLYEPTGIIEIDDIDTQKIRLNELRQKVSVIPQDPVIFSGTIRYNLDPFNKHNESELWAALEKVQLKSKVNEFDGKLEALLSDGGGNLSVGQRQMICLARAILRQNRILILDGATANVDHQTDYFIQTAIRKEFKSCTVITITHRLKTIINSDRIIVLDSGKVVEYGLPYQLLKNRNIFYDMCKKTGPTMFSHLYRLAKSLHLENANRIEELE